MHCQLSSTAAAGTGATVDAAIAAILSCWRGTRTYEHTCISIRLFARRMVKSSCHNIYPRNTYVDSEALDKGGFVVLIHKTFFKTKIRKLLNPFSPPLADEWTLPSGMCSSGRVSQAAL